MAAETVEMAGTAGTEATGTAAAATADMSEADAAATAGTATVETEGAARAEATGTAGAATADTSDAEAAETASTAELEAAGVAGTMQMEGERAVEVDGVDKWGSLACLTSSFFHSVARIWENGSALSSSKSSWGFPAAMNFAVRADGM
jgi:hypothetical protein